MDKQLLVFIAMSFPKRFIQLRKEHKLTQQEMADKIGMHITQVKRYEAGQTRPSIEILKKIATAFHVTADWLIFEEGERDLPNSQQLKFEAVMQMSDEDQRTIQSLIDGMILKHAANQLTAAKLRMATADISIPQKQLDKVSKFLSFVLRHKPEAINLELDTQGWAGISDLIEKASSEIPLTAELIKQFVVTNDKQRFSLSEDGQRIRANQGHSIKVDLDLTPKTPPTNLYHGTATRFLPSILEKGLQPGQRHHVHLSIDIETATSVGQRYGKPVILQVASGEMYQQGYVFFLSKNGVWLTECVPPELLQKANVTISTC